MAEGARITIDAQLQFRHDVEANWLAADPILKVGEPAYTIGYSDRFKLGDGQSKWSELPYLQLGEGGSGGGSQAYESLAWSAIKNLTSGSASVLAQAYAVKQAYTELKSLIPNLADYYTKEQVNALIPSLAGYATEAWVLGKGYATESFVNTKIADLINGAPSTLDTLKEIADAFAASQDVIEALDEAIGKKANQSDLAALAERVAANEGNITSLSSNKLDKSVWDSVFEIDAKGNLRAKVGIYSTSFISARTSDPSAGGGGEGGGGAFSLYTWDQVKAMTAEVGGVAPTAYALKQAYNELINATPTLSWNNIQDKPIFATVATSGSYSDLIGRPTALSDLANDVGYITSAALGGLASESWVSNNFLGLRGGMLYNGVDNSPLVVKGVAEDAYIGFQHGNGNALGAIGINANLGPVYWDSANRVNHTLIHSGNIGSQSVNYATSAGNASYASSAGSVDMPSVTSFDDYRINSLYVWHDWGGGVNTYSDYSFGISVNSPDPNHRANIGFDAFSGDVYIKIKQGANNWRAWQAIAFTDSNVASATKLQTARTIWGQSFDGTANIDTTTYGMMRWLYFSNSSGVEQGYVGRGSDTNDIFLSVYGENSLRFQTNSTTRATITPNGNVLIGTTEGSIGTLQVAQDITILPHSGGYADMRFMMDTTQQECYILSARGGESGKPFKMYYTPSAKSGVYNELMSISTEGAMQIAKTLTIVSDAAYNNSTEGGELILMPPSAGNYVAHLDIYMNQFRVWSEHKTTGATAAPLSLDMSTGSLALSGNVGIGTTSPERALDVVGDIGATGTVVANNFYGRVDNADRVSPTEQLLVLQSEGSGMIARCPGIGFHLSGYAYSTIKMRSDGSFGFYNNQLTGYVDVQCNNITADGTIYSAVGMYSPGYISARSTAGSSDRNLKTNIAPVKNALAYILGTKYVSFDWKDTGEHSVGIIAQDELNREWSCLVQKYSEHYSYQYTQHTALIGSALQEEDKKVEALRAEMATLKNKVQKLERQLWQQ